MFVSRPVHKSAHSRDLLAEGHTKWPAITSTANAALEYFIKIKILKHEIEGVHVTFKSTYLCIKQRLSQAVRQSFRLAVKLLQVKPGQGC